MTLPKSLLLAASAATLLAAGSAQAETFNGLDLTVGYDTFDIENGDDLEALWSKLESGVTFEKFTLDGSVAFSDDGEHSTVFSIAPSYAFDFGLTLGAFYDLGEIDSTFKADTQHYGITADYQTGALALSGYLGVGELDDGFEIDSDIAGLSASYVFSRAFDAGVFFDREKTEFFRMDAYGLEADYAFNVMGQPLVASASYTEFSHNDSGRVSVALSLPFGNRGDTHRGAERFHDHSVAFNTNYAAD